MGFKSTSKQKRQVNHEEKTSTLSVEKTNKLKLQQNLQDKKRGRLTARHGWEQEEGAGLF